MVKQKYFVLGSNICDEQYLHGRTRDDHNIEQKIHMLESLFVFIKIIGKIVSTAYLLAPLSHFHPFLSRTILLVQ